MPRNKLSDIFFNAVGIIILIALFLFLLSN